MLQKRSALESTGEILDINIRERELDVVLQTKYLGVQIDCSLNWKKPIKAISAKVSKAIGFLKHFKAFIPRETLKKIYTSIVWPHFWYCCSVWGCFCVIYLSCCLVEFCIRSYLWMKDYVFREQ